MLQPFESLLPEVIFDAAEQLGGRCTGRFLALNAMENRVYDIEKEDGTHVVIKFYRPGRWSKETIQAEHDFLAKLVENEVPAVAPLKHTAGETILKSGEIWFTVFPKTMGRLEPELNPEQLTRLGRFLARIHTVGSSFRNVPRMALNPQTLGLDSLTYLMTENLIPGTLAPRYQQLVERLCTDISPFFSSIETVLLHGDCHCGNVLWRANEPFFIDFDDMLYAPPVQDIWMLTGADDEDGKERRELLLEAYEEMRPFDRSTLRLIEPLRTLRIIYFSAWIGRRREDGAFKQAFPLFGTERYWQDQIEALSVQLEKVHHQQSH